MENSNATLISYAIGTEVDAINMYSFMIRNLPDECRQTLEHIRDEEREHALELIGLLKRLSNAD